ncbi:MAG: FAD-dependent oxidoreductase [Proteobacteria bacterium]|nr:FAD-dependent oxidoreductase [Pseudomonadota bacterium]
MNKPSPDGRDAVVVGAGMVGICTALSLQAKGFRVRLVDRDGPAEGASSGNAGVISPWSCVPQSLPGVLTMVPKWLLDPLGPVRVRWLYAPRLLPWLVRFIRAGGADRLPAIGDAMMALNRYSVDLFREHLDGTGREDLVQDSLYVHVYRDATGANLNDISWRMRSERNVPLQVINGDELHEIEPDLSPDYKSAVLIKDQGRAVDPEAIGKTLADRMVRQGGDLVRADVQRLRPQPDGSVIVDTTAGELSASLVVVSAGVWTRELLAPLGVRLLIEAERGYHLVFPDPGVTARNTIMDPGGRFVANSMAMGMRCAGTSEWASIDAPPDYRRADIFATLGKRLFPALNTEGAKPWMGRRPTTPDSLPYIGPLPDYPNIIVAAGHAHLGLTGAPMTGRLVSQIAAGETPNTDMSPYSLTRY